MNRLGETQLRKLRIGLVLVNFVFLLVIPMQLRGDDEVRVEDARLMLDGVDVRTKYSVALMSVFRFLLWLGRLFGNDLIALQVLLPALLTTAALLLSSEVARGRGEFAGLISAQASLFSIAGVYAVSPSSDLFSAALIVIGLLLLTRTRRLGLAQSIASVIAMTVGAWNVQPHIAGLAVVGIGMLIRARRPEALLAAVLATTLVIVEASLFQGNLAWSKYGLEGGAPNVLPWEGVVGFGYPVIFGTVGVLFSLGRGLIYFIPSLWFSTERLSTGQPHQVGWLLLHTFALVPVYGSWWAWYGGVGFGPRFFVIGAFAGSGAIAIALSATAGISLRRTVFGVLALSLSSYVAAIGMFIGITNNSFNVCTGDSFRLEPLCWYSAEYSPLLSPLWDDFSPLGARQLAYVALIGLSTISISALLFARWYSTRASMAANAVA